jgi:hypothetical protein
MGRWRFGGEGAERLTVANFRDDFRTLARVTHPVYAFYVNAFHQMTLTTTACCCLCCICVSSGEGKRTD